MRPLKCAWASRAATAFLLALLAGSGCAAADCPEPASPRPIEGLSGAWSVATQNLWRLRDSGVPEQEVDARLDALADYLHQRLAYPHLLLVQEVENRELLERLAQRVAERGGPDYDVWLMEGQDPSGIDVGALSRAPVRIRQMSSLFDQARLGSHWLFSRPPLHLQLEQPLDMDVLVLHLRSGRGLQDPDSGPRVQAKRRAQAQQIADWVRAQGAQGRRVLVGGDINSAPDTGVFAEPLQILLAAPLQSAWAQLPSAERYSYVYRCRPQAIDHLLMSSNLLPLVQQVQVSRGNAGRYRRLHGSGGTEVVSDHDGLVVWFKGGVAAVGKDQSGE